MNYQLFLIIIALKILLLFFVIKLFEVFIYKKINTFFKLNRNFFGHDFFEIIKKSMFCFGIDSLLTLIAETDFKTRRNRQLALAVLNLSQVIYLPVLMYVIFLLNINGFFSGMSLLYNNYGEPQNEVILKFINLFSTTSISHILFLFSFGILLNLIFRKFGLALIIAFVLLFPFIVSIPNALFLILGENFLNTLKKVKNVKDGFLRVFVQLVSIVVFWLLGPELQNLVFMVGVNNTDLIHRILQLGILYGIFLAIDTILAMILFHVYYLVGGEKNEST